MLLPVFLQVNIRIIIQELNKQKNLEIRLGFYSTSKLIIGDQKEAKATVPNLS
jgi:hypothetical protein